MLLAKKLQNRTLFLFSFAMVAMLHGYVLQNINTSHQVITVKPQKKVSSVIRLQHINMKIPEPVAKPAAEEVPPEPQEPVVDAVVTLPKKTEKRSLPKVMKKKKTFRKKAVKKKLRRKRVVKRKTRQASSSPNIKVIKDNYLAKIRREIEQNKRYPRSAKRLKQQGAVWIRFTIYADGHIGPVTLVKKSSYAKLNKAAVKILKRVGAFAPIPKELKKGSLSLTVPVRYKILD